MNSICSRFARTRYIRVLRNIFSKSANRYEINPFRFWHISPLARNAKAYRVRQHILSLYISPLARYANHIENPRGDLSRCVFSVKDNTLSGALLFWKRPGEPVAWVKRNAMRVRIRRESASSSLVSAKRANIRCKRNSRCSRFPFVPSHAPKWVMFLAENLYFEQSASSCFSSVETFTFVKYVHERWIRYVLAMLRTLKALYIRFGEPQPLELDILSLR